MDRPTYNRAKSPINRLKGNWNPDRPGKSAWLRLLYSYHEQTNAMVVAI